MEQISSAVVELATKYLGDYKVRNGQIVPKLCPFCKGGDHQDYESFAIGLYNGAWNCRRGSCPGINGDGKVREGDFRALANYFGSTEFKFQDLPRNIQFASKAKKYVKPNPNEFKPYTEEILAYLVGRHISEQTIKDFGILSDKDGNIVFPFYRDNELTFVKYRIPQKYTKESSKPKEWRMSNTEPILFGMDMVSFNRPLVITEGEIDAMSLYEAGVTNVVSVPSGCEDLTWCENCWSWLEKFNEIILFGDNDEPGLKMISTLKRRLGEDRCMIPKDYPELIYNDKDYNRQCKDANEILICYGPENLKEIVESCEPAPIKGILEVASIPYEDPTKTPRIMTGIPKLDNMIGGFGEGGVTIISGKRGEGKSTITARFILQAIQQDYKVCAYSGELSSYKFLDWTFLPATESRYITYVTDPRSGKNICKVPEEIQQRIRDWLAGKLFLFDNSYIFEEDQQTAVLSCFEMCARRYDCKLFVIDNIMSLLTTADEENRAQAKFMAKVKAFAAKYKVHVIVIAHPRKEKADQTFTSDSVSGSSVITNLADSVFSIEKPDIRVTKNRDFGDTGYIVCNYDPVNRRIFQEDVGDRVVYGWDHTGIKEPEARADQLPEFQLRDAQSDRNPF